MLVLTRKVDESLVIDGRIVVTVLAVDGDRVKIGIEAPREVLVLRRELFQDVKEANLSAADIAGNGAEELLPVVKRRLQVHRNGFDPR